MKIYNDSIKNKNECLLIGIPTQFHIGRHHVIFRVGMPKNTIFSTIVYKKNKKFNMEGMGCIYCKPTHIKSRFTSGEVSAFDYASNQAIAPPETSVNPANIFIS